MVNSKSLRLKNSQRRSEI